MRTFEVYKGMPFRYIVKKDRYWDMTCTDSINEDTYRSVQLDVYNGIAATAELNNGYVLATVGSDYLPDEEMFYGMQGVIAPVGSHVTEIYGYYNFMTRGTPTLDAKSGLVTGFSAANYLTTQVELPEVFTIYVKFTPTTNGSNNIILSNQTTGASPIRSDGLKLSAWSGSGSGGDFAMTAGKTYWAKGVVSGATYQLYGMEDTGLSLEEAKASENWTLSWSCDSAWMFSLNAINELNLGRNTNSYTSQYLTGSIDLSGTGIFASATTLWSPYGLADFVLPGMLAEGIEDDGAAKVYNMFHKDGKVVLDTAEKRTGETWIGTVNIPAHEVKTPQAVNFSVVGDVKFKDNKASFNAGGALVTSKGLPYSEFFAQDIRFVAHVTTGESVSAAQDIFWDNNMHDHGFGIYRNKWRIWNGAAATGGAVQANTSYWVMLVQSVNDGCKLYYLLDDQNYAPNALPELSSWAQGPSIAGLLFNEVGGNVRIGNGFASVTEYWQGAIDITRLKIETRTPDGVGAWSTWWTSAA